jgi:hypothetical protein
MRPLIRFVIVIIMSTVTLAQTLPVPRAITDPKQIISKPNARVDQRSQSLSLEKLYMTRSMGGTTWSPNGKTIAFVSNISGRNNLWLVAAEGGWPSQLTISANRPGRPMENGSPISPTTMAMSSGIFFWSRRRLGK